MRVSWLGVRGLALLGSCCDEFGEPEEQRRFFFCRQMQLVRQLGGKCETVVAKVLQLIALERMIETVAQLMYWRVRSSA